MPAVPKLIVVPNGANSVIGIDQSHHSVDFGWLVDYGWSDSVSPFIAPRASWCKAWCTRNFRPLECASCGNRTQGTVFRNHARVSEVANEVGFQSLTHFNRVFKCILGHSPTNYREELTRN